MRTSTVIVLGCIGILVVPLVFAAMVVMFIPLFFNFHDGVSSSASSHGSGVLLAVFIVFGALPLLIYLVRRGFSKRQKRRNRNL